MDALDRIEAIRNFRLPTAYRACAARGYLTHPGNAYLWVTEAEWVPPSSLDQYQWAKYAKPRPGLIPFAFSGRGDHWCWNLERIAPSGEPAVVNCPHDDTEGEWYAPSFIAWLYRRSLECAVDMSGDETDTKSDLRAWNNLVREFGPAAWADDLEAIIARAPVESEYQVGSHRVKATGLLTVVELQDRIRRACGDGYLDVPFTWDLDAG